MNHCRLMIALAFLLAAVAPAIAAECDLPLLYGPSQ
jgi:hypothetical protein